MIAHELTQCDDASVNRAQYLACVNHHTSNWVRYRFITKKNQQSIKACAAQAPQ